MGFLNELRVIRGHETILRDEYPDPFEVEDLTSRVPPGIIDPEEEIDHSDTLDPSFIVHRLPDLGYDEAFKDLGMVQIRNPRKRTPADVRRVVARLRTMLPSLPEDGDEYALPHPRNEMKGLIAFLEKNATTCERTGESMWFYYD